VLRVDSPSGQSAGVEGRVGRRGIVSLRVALCLGWDGVWDWARRGLRLRRGRGRGGGALKVWMGMVCGLLSPWALGGVKEGGRGLP
jgi:hypothetical protein